MSIAKTNLQKTGIKLHPIGSDAKNALPTTDSYVEFLGLSWIFFDDNNWVRTMITSTCPYCFNEKMMSADAKQWMIHLSEHRADIIYSMSLAQTSCLLCQHDLPFGNRINAESHYRWDHKRSEITKWAFTRLSGVAPVYPVDFVSCKQGRTKVSQG